MHELESTKPNGNNNETQKKKQQQTLPYNRINEWNRIGNYKHDNEYLMIFFLLPCVVCSSITFLFMDF